jgi:hypothetical protein
LLHFLPQRIAADFFTKSMENYGKEPQSTPNLEDPHIQTDCPQKNATIKYLGATSRGTSEVPGSCALKAVGPYLEKFGFLITRSLLWDFLDVASNARRGSAHEFVRGKPSS